MEPTILRRISWGAVLAGALVALAVQLVLGILGLSIGASTINPTTEANPFEGIRIGAAIWFAVSAVISLFVGGWVAGRLSGVPRRLDSTLNAVTAWSVAALAGFYLLSTTAGSLIGGTASILGKGITAMASGVGPAAVAPALAGIDTDELKRQALDMAQDAGQPQGPALVQPGQLGAAGGRGEPMSPQAQRQVSAVIDRLLQEGGQGLKPEDRQAAVNVLVTNANMTPQQAAQTVDQWQQTFQKARLQAQHEQQAAVQKAREAGERVASGTAKAAGWTTALLLLGLVAAAAGGFVGTVREPQVRGLAVV